jgi:hypothetical protein
MGVGDEALLDSLYACRERSIDGGGCFGAVPLVPNFVFVVAGRWYGALFHILLVPDIVGALQEGGAAAGASVC